MKIKARKRKALAHQVTALEWANQRKCIGLFMRMRLGKTLVAIRWAQNKQPKKGLVITPLTVVSEWQKELEFEHIYNSKTLHGKREDWQGKLDGPSVWYLTNYGCVQANPSLLDHEWDFIILDESTIIRKPTAGITKLINKETYHIPNRAALTGMPNPESMLDLFEQMCFLNGSFLGHTNYYEFRDEHFNNVHYGWHLKRKSNPIITGEMHKHSFILTRKDVGIGSTPVHQVRWVKLPDKIRVKYDELEKTWAIGDLETAHAFVKRLWLGQIAGGFAFPEITHHAKSNELKYLLEGELRREQVIVWFRSNLELLGCQKILSKANISNTVIHGKVKVKERKHRLERFRKGKYRIFLAQAKCAGIGLDCSNADTMIYFSRWDDGEINMQSQERFIHPKFKNAKLIIDLACKDTVNVDVITAVKSKQFQQGMLGNQLFKSLIVDNWKERLAV